MGSATAGVFLVSESESLDSDSESESGGASMSLHQLRPSSLMSSRVSSFSSASELRSNATAARAGVSLLGMEMVAEGAWVPASRLAE